MIDVAVGEDANVDFLVANDLLHVFFFDNGNAFGIHIAREFAGIPASSNVGNLCGGESDYLIVGVVTEDNIEVMKITACGSKYKYTFHRCR